MLIGLFFFHFRVLDIYVLCEDLCFIKKLVHLIDLNLSSVFISPDPVFFQFFICVGSYIYLPFLYVAFVSFLFPFYNFHVCIPQVFLFGLVHP